MLDPKKSLFDDNGNPRPALTKTLDTVLRVQRPLALSMVKSLRAAHPDETPEKILRRLERNYLRDVTGRIRLRARNWNRDLDEPFGARGRRVPGKDRAVRPSGG